MDLRFASPGGVDGSPFEGPGSPFGPWSPGVPTSTAPVPSPPIPTAGSRLTVKRVPGSDPRLVAFTELVGQILNSLIRRGELTYVADDDLTRRWALDPTASPNFPGTGLTGTFNSGTFGSG